MSPQAQQQPTPDQQAQADPTIVNQIVGQIPTASVAAIVALVTALTVSGSKNGVPPVPPLAPARSVTIDAATAIQPRVSPSGTVTRLVSCGDSTKAMVAGDDTEGAIVLGPGALGTCTLLFSTPWPSPPNCAVNGGTIGTVTPSDLMIINIPDVAVSYSCGPT